MRLIALLLPVVLLLGCAPGAAPAPAPAGRWAATLEARPGFPAVEARVTAVRAVGSTSVEVELTGAEPNAQHPWHVHQGTCETGGGIVGDPGRYPPLRVGAGGRALEIAVIDVELVAGQSYHVNVHRAPGDMGTIVACGNLREAGAP
jgi:hypothetical protein